MLTYAHVCSRMLAYAHVCSRMLTHADVCSRMLTYEVSQVRRQRCGTSKLYLTTCFTSTKVQILTQKALPQVRRQRCCTIQSASQCAATPPSSTRSSEHTSACVSMRQHTYALHTSAYVSVRCDTTLLHEVFRAYVSMRQHASAYVSIRMLSIRQHTSQCAATPPSSTRSSDSLQRALIEP
jgi:hypothetical protein